MYFYFELKMCKIKWGVYEWFENCVFSMALSWTYLCKFQKFYEDDVLCKTKNKKEKKSKSNLKKI